MMTEIEEGIVVSVSKFDNPDVQMGMKLFLLRGAYGYKGFSEKMKKKQFQSLRTWLCIPRA